MLLSNCSFKPFLSDPKSRKDTKNALRITLRLVVSHLRVRSYLVSRTSRLRWARLRLTSTMKISMAKKDRLVFGFSRTEVFFESVHSLSFSGDSQLPLTNLYFVIYYQNSIYKPWNQLHGQWNQNQLKTSAFLWLLPQVCRVGWWSSAIN